MKKPCISLVNHQEIKGEEYTSCHGDCKVKFPLGKLLLLCGHNVSSLLILEMDQIQQVNLHLLASSSSNASDHSWASSGEGLQEKFCVLAHACQRFPFQLSSEFIRKYKIFNLLGEGLLFAFLAGFGLPRRGGILQEVAQTALPIFQS